jgi:outer membrane protein OmpA-like peptidoglycan-associated protein
VSEQWIRGEFEGTYVGERLSPASGAGEARRFSFEVHSGTVRDFELLSSESIVDELEEGLEDAGESIRQVRVRRVMLGDPDEGEGARETTLFDVRISDFRLRRPAESGKRSYGTVEGTIRARLLPPGSAPRETPEPAPDPARPAPPAPKKHARARHVGRRHPRRTARPEHLEAPSAAEQYTRARWWITLVGLASIGLVLAVACGPSIAALWAAPILVAMVVRRGLGRFALTQPWLHWPLGAALVAVQLWVLASPLETAWALGCRTPIRAELFSLALPILGAVLLRRRGWVLVTTLLWTGVMCTWCSQLDGTCTGVPALADSAVRSAPDPAHVETPSWQPPPRTDPSGRWPAVPGVPRSQSGGPNVRGPMSGPTYGAPIGVPGSASSAPGGAPGGPIVIQPGASSTGPGGPISMEPQASPTYASRDGGPVRIVVEPGDGSVPSPSLVSRPGLVPPAATVDPQQWPASSTAPGVTSGRAADPDGGWVAPDHRRTPREQVLISVEHANRVPESFFGNRETRRVYLPTDPIFEAGGSRIRATGALDLSRLAALLSLHPERRVAIEVHTDAAGSAEAQLELSRRRAGAVSRWLVDRGHLDPRQLDIAGVGGRRPLVPPDGSYAAQQPNRRLEVRLID